MTDPIIRINELRARVRDGETITREEAAEAIRLLREQRAGVVEKAQAKDKAAAPLNLNDLFS